MWFFSKKSPAKSDFGTASPAAAEAPASGTVLDMLRATVSRISRDHVRPTVSTSARPCSIAATSTH